MTIERIEGGGIMVTGDEDIALYRMLALRGALHLEVLGMKRHGRSVYSIVKQEFGFRGNKQKVYDQLCEEIEDIKAAREERTCTG